MSKQQKSTNQKRTLDKKKMELKEKNKQLSEIKAELVKKEYQDNLTNYLEEKLYELQNKMIKTEAGQEMSIIEIKDLISQKNVIGLSPKYNNTEIAILFDYYKRFIKQINNKIAYLPTKEDFCSFAGISTTMYNNWKRSEDAERREIIQMIDDYLVDIHLTMAQHGDIKEITSIFRAKSEFGLVEAQAPTVIEHKATVDLEDIQKQISAVKNGESLKNITLEKKEDGSYGAKEE